MAVVFQDAIPTLRVTCYLLRDSLSDPIDALSAASRPGGREGMTEVAGTGVGVEGARAFMAANRERKPPWADGLEIYFPDVALVRNTSSRLVVFLPVRKRLFAICFGYGGASLSSAAIDPNFGLRYAARTFDPDSIFELDSRRISATARSQSVQTLSGVALSELDVPLLGEFVRKLAGRLDDGASAEVEGVSTVVATDGVGFKTEMDLDLISRVLGQMLTVTESDDAKDEFEFIDALEPLRSTDERVKNLEEAMVAELNRRLKGLPENSEVLLSLVPPESPSVDALDSVKVIVGADEHPMDDLSLESLLRLFLALGNRFSRASLRSVKLAVVDADGNMGPTAPLRSWLVFEAAEAEERFILTLGRWFAIDKGFSDRLDGDLALVDDVTADLMLPDWPASMVRENEYNELARDERAELLLLDKVKFYSNGSQVEVCDLLSDTGHLIHVKRWDKSATLSHLFSQGLVSLEVLNGDPTYASEVADHIAKYSTAHVTGFAEYPRKVVYAIGLRGGRALPESLPTFSKVNLRDFLQRIRGRGGRPSIARIQMLD